jgi:hypothetical protein
MCSKPPASAELLGRLKGYISSETARGKSRGSRGKSKGHSSLELKLQLSLKSTEIKDLLLKKVKQKSKISRVKVHLEKKMGILPDMYYLSYLDIVPMDDSSRLCDHDVVNHGTLRINVWRLWQGLLKAALLGNIKECLSNSLNVSGTSDWNRYCAWVALYIASHHGHHNLVAELLKKTTLPINFTSPIGWTVLHAATQMGRWKVVCMLIDSGIDVRITDNEGLSAHDLSRINGHKQCENSLAFAQWNLQKYRIVQERKLDFDAVRARQMSMRLAHQMVDSTLPIGFRGPAGQIYRANVDNPVPVEAVKKFEKEKAANPNAKENLRARIEADLTCHDTDGKLDFNYGWFDEVRAQQLIPSTRDIIRYSDPSSCELRPRSLLNPKGYKLNLYPPPPPPATPSLPPATPSLPPVSSPGRRGTLTTHPKRSHSPIVRVQKMGGAASAAKTDLRTPVIQVHVDPPELLFSSLATC